MRDNAWLLSRLDYLWSKHFAEMNQPNRVFIRFGRFARLRFGSIMLDRKTGNSYIILSGMFRDERIPINIVDHTIAHELCHYAHGFSSPHAQLHRYPHEGGVIKKEMERRGMIHLYKAYWNWIKEYRQELKEYYQRKRSG